MSKVNKEGVLIETGSTWVMVAHRNGSLPPFKVMGFVDSWVVMRRKTCMPIVVHMNRFGTEYVQP